MKKIILATASPYRQGAFEMLGIDFEASVSNIDEEFSGRPNDPQELVRELAKRKAEFVARKYESGIVIGFDSIGYFEGEVLEKPKTREESFKRIRKLSGKTHYFYTGICIIDIEENKKLSQVTKTDIKLRDITDSEIEKYLDQDPKFNTYAIGFDPLGHYSSTFVESLTGSYNNYLRGIPLEAIVGMLKEVGVKI
ncbi:MAG: Maf family nucleotide pyrophosphatase [Parcubacteria group bacterium]|jgi:septum formation protein